MAEPSPPARRITSATVPTELSISPLTSKMPPFSSRAIISGNAAIHQFVRVGELALIGAGAIVLPGITIGRESLIGAGAVVCEDVPPRVVVSGNPARVMREI